MSSVSAHDKHKCYVCLYIACLLTWQHPVTQVIWDFAPADHHIQILVTLCVGNESLTVFDAVFLFKSVIHISSLHYFWTSRLDSVNRLFKWKFMDFQFLLNCEVKVHLLSSHSSHVCIHFICLAILGPYYHLSMT